MPAPAESLFLLESNKAAVLDLRSPARTEHPVSGQVRMGTVCAVVALAAIAVHGFVELLENGKLITGVFFADLQLVGSAYLGFGERIAVIATGGDTDRHGLVHLV